MPVLFHELPVGSTLELEGAAKITVVHKTGKKVRLKIDSDAKITVKNSTQAQECRNKGVASDG